MTVRETITRSSGINICETVVNIDGMKITIGVSECVYADKSEALDGDFEYIVPNTDKKIHLYAWLVKLQDTEELTVLVDECLAGVEAYKWGDENIKRLFPLITANIPASAEDLESSDILVHKCLRVAAGEGDGE